LKANIRNELILLNLLVVVLIIVILLFPSNVARIVLGLPFLLFFPGYSLLAALFPRKEAIDAIERIALSFGLSIAVVPLIGLILNYTPWGIRLEPILYSVASFIFITSIIGWLRRRTLPPSERLRIDFQLKAPGWGGSAWDKALSVILIIAILAALGTLAYVIATPKVGERFTEFYLLGLEGKAENYPRELTPGEEGRLIVGIVNREHEPASYEVEITINGDKVGEIGPVTLNHEESWEQEVSFAATRAGPDQKLEFLLHKGANTEPYLRLHLWLDVREAP